MSEDEWVLVRGKSEPTKKFRVLQRGKNSNELAKNPENDLDEKAGSKSLNQESNVHHSLVGAPIRAKAGCSDLPRVERGGTAVNNVTTESEMRDKIGGSFHLAQQEFSPSCLLESSNTADFNLSDFVEWPSMGLEGDMSPQLSAWSAVVKQPPPPVDRRQHQLLELSVDEERENEKKRKKKKNNNKDAIATKREPLTLELSALFQELELKQSKRIVVATGGGLSLPKQSKGKVVSGSHEDGSRSGNAMDSSAPAIRRGKEREVPKKKRPSALRKVITKEKMELKKEREQKDNGIEGQSTDKEAARREEEMALRTTKQTSIHNRKFREYCNHLVSEKIDDCVEKLLSDLRHFQERQYLKDPIKGKAKRRYVCGLREVLKHLKLKKIKCVVVPPNLDKIRSEGGINEFIDQILLLCEEQSVAVVFAMSRRRLAFLLHKTHRVGCVGIFFYDGAEEHYKRLMELVASARQDYISKVTCLPTGQSADLSKDLDTWSNAESSSDEFEEHFFLNADAQEFVPSCSLNADVAVSNP